MDEGLDAGTASLQDEPTVRALLVEAARVGEPLTYSAAMAALGHRFSRPGMRILCRTLDRIDRAAEADGEPKLAALVVRAKDGLPGGGWWSGRHGAQGDGPATPKDALEIVERLQREAFDHWRNR